MEVARGFGGSSKAASEKEWAEEGPLEKNCKG